MSSIIFMGTLIIAFLAAGWFAGGVWGLLAGGAMAAAVAGIAFVAAERILIRLCDAEPLTNARLQTLAGAVCHEAKLPLPAFYHIRSPAMNAFAAGKSPKKALVVVTDGLLSLNDDELESVMAHELTHVKWRDTIITGMAAVVGLALSYHIEKLFRSRQPGKRRIIAVAALVLGSIAAFAVRMGHSKKQEFRADWFGMVLTKKPEALASALRKMSGPAVSAATTHLWTVPPLGQNWFNELFTAHPHMEQRLERLEVVRSGT